MMIEILVELLKQTSDKNTKAILLQSYIQQLGAIPDKYGDVVRELLEGGGDE
jgi:hypothetical protein